MKPVRFRIPLRAVFYKEGGNWIVHCLEFDLAGHGTTRKAAMKMLVQAIGLQLDASLKFRNSRNLFTPADGKLFAMFAAGRDIAKGELKVELTPLMEDDLEIEGIQIREFSGSDPLVLA